MAAEIVVQLDQDLAKALAVSYGTTTNPNQLCDECRKLVCSSVILQQWRQRWLQVRRAISQGTQVEDIAHKRKQHIEVTWIPAFRASVKTSSQALPCKERVRHHQDLAALMASAAMHCHMCSVLLSARIKAGCQGRGELWLIETGEVETPIRLMYRRAGEGDLIPLMAQFEPSLEVQGFLKRLALGTLNIDAVPSIQHLLSDRLNLHSCPSSTHTASVDALSKIKTWLNDCQANHHPCNHHISPGLHSDRGTTIPTRLLEITNNPLSLRYIPGTFLESQRVAKYVALSYRWGETSWDDSSLLTKDKLAAWHDKIQFSILPKTLQDAIYVSYHLGFRYLWIDRLCILQDCEDDFAQEAAKMGVYYANAALNIATLDATGAQDKLIAERNPLTLQPCHFEALGLTLCTEEQLQSSKPPLSVPTASSWRSQHGLQSRAWIFQEEHLSPRTVYFSHSYIFWECRDHCESEPSVLPFPRCYVDDGGNFVQKSETPEKSRWVRRVLERSMRMQAAEEYYFPDLWARTLVEYTQRKLSKESDRWRAIEGMAGILGAMSRNTAPWYTMRHGLWAHDLSFELMWQPSHNKKIAEGARLCDGKDVLVHRRLFNVAPSWSWASISGPILPFHKRRTSSAYSWHPLEDAEEGPLTQGVAGHADPQLSSISRANFVWDNGCQIVSDIPGAWAVTTDNKLEAADSPSLKFYLSSAAAESSTRFVSDLDICEGGLVALVALHLDLETQGYCGLVIRAKDQERNQWTRCGTFWGSTKSLWPKPAEQNVPELEISSQPAWHWPWKSRPKTPEPAPPSEPEEYGGPGCRTDAGYEFKVF